MGERIFRPGIRTSDRTANLVRSGGWMAQVFYDWLITLVDDFGRYDARPAILRVEVFPLLLDLVRESDAERCLAACEKAGLIRLYTVNGKPYLELLDFRQRLRAAKSKFPPPPTSAGHCHDNAMTMTADTDTDSETDTEKPATQASAATAHAATADDPALISFPCVAGRKKGATSWDFRKSFHDELAEAFPDVDLIFEAKKAIAWIKADMKRRKTYDGMRKFLTGWMNRAQNDPRSRKNQSQSGNGEIIEDVDPTPEEAQKEFIKLGLIDPGESNAA